MYDTIILKSPEIDIYNKDLIIQFCNKYEGIEIETGEIVYTFTRGELEGSYDYRIRISLDNCEWIKEEGQSPKKIESYWYLKVECSLHKLMMNHNVYGGPTNIKKSIKYLIDFLEKSMNVTLPNFRMWEVLQVDVSMIFKFSDKSICKRIITNLKNSYYSRRKPIIYDTTVMFSGSTTTNKFYWKGPEFEKHDYKRMVRYLKKQIDMNHNVTEYFDIINQKLSILLMKYDNILEKAYRIIRFECSIKTRKLKEIFESETVLVYFLDDGLLRKIKNEELRKLIKEDDEMDIVRRSDLVLEKLKNTYGTRMAGNLYSTWAQLVQFGQEQTRDRMKKSTLYDHLKLLREAGCSWTCSMVNLKPFSIVPDDFSFLNTKYVDETVDIEVTMKLEMVS